MNLVNIKSIYAVVLLTVMLFTGVAQAQITTKAFVVDESGYPLVGAVVKFNSQRVVTDSQGSFSIAPQTVVTIEMSGHKSKTVTITAKNSVVTLIPNPIEQQTTVLYGAQKRFGTTSAISTISGKQLEDEFVSNVGRTLSGKLSGLTVMQQSGEPGADMPQFYIRGRSSWNTSKPVVYVDGFEASLDYLNPMEIESISVLKDAGALAQFGIKGANGVVWVTTKRGKIGKPKVEISVDHGWQQAVSTPEFADSYQYASLYNEALSNDKGAWTQYYSQEKLDAYKRGNDGTIDNYDLLYPNVNWYDKVLKSFAPATNANVSFSGGNKVARYYMMLGYQNVDGLYDGTDKKRDINSNVNFQKFNYRANIDATLGKIFTIAATVGGDISDRYTPDYSTSTLWSNMASYPANAFPVVTPKGYGGTVLYPDNPVGSVLETGYRQFHTRNIQAGITVGEDLGFITNGLKLWQTMSIYNTQGQFFYKEKNYSRFSPYIDNDGELQYTTIGTADTDFSISQTGNSRNSIFNRINTEIGIGYDRTFGKNSVSASVVYHGDKMVVEGVKVPTYTRGFAGRVNYSYDNRYFTEVGYAINGMSPYSPKHSIGYFPSLSAAWVLSNESFMKDCSVVDYLKLRASVGVVGMADLESASNYFMYQQYYHEKTLTPRFGWDGTATASSIYEYYIANEEASWEKSLKTNVGIDIQMFNKRLEASFDFFYENRYDILTPANVPGYFGILSDTNLNLGEVTNRGVELSLNWSDHVGDFSYYINPTFSFARNKITDMNEAPAAYDYQKQTGTRIGTYLYLKSNGLFQSWEQVNNPDTPQSMYETVQPGDINYVDMNRDGYINDNDRTYLTNYYTSIPEITYGISIGASYKGIDMNVTGYGAANSTISVRNYLNSAYESGTGNLSKWAMNRWAYYPQQGIDTRSHATYPRLSAGSNTHNWRSSTFWLRNGNFFRISDITLGYTLPRSFTSKIRIDKLRFYVMASNLHSFDNLEVGDVECQTGYPLMRTFKIGLNLNF